jgi:CBS domain-containing protein
MIPRGMGRAGWEVFVPLVRRKIGCLPVLEAGREVGILTEGDFVLLAAGQETGVPEARPKP